MKLRLFIVGPFRWHCREGKWEFKFNPGGILVDSGGTGMAPAKPGLPLWHDVVLTFAGPLVNLLLGSAALWVAITVDPASSVQSYGFPALFGAWSMTSFVLNLVPLRLGTQYSDGARIYQLITKGPWADFHRAVSVVTSSLVTPLRPRDYDMRAIQRASVAINQGLQGLILRLYAYSHYLDCGLLIEARQALAEAELIYHDSASDIRADLYTVFVFGTAYLNRDSAATRHWWERMEAKKPTHFNVDYWRAKSALHWIEADIEAATEAWKTSTSLAEQLPHAGAYEFDRYCCELLGEEIRAGKSRLAASTSSAG